VSAGRPPLSQAAAQLLCERYGASPKGDVVGSPVDERFGQAFAWGIPVDGAPPVEDQAAIRTRVLADELAAFDNYKPNETSFGGGDTMTAKARLQNIDLWEGSEHVCWPGRLVDGMPEFDFNRAPAGLSTRRQLRDASMCPGGREPFGRLRYGKNGRGWAWLYITAYAKPSRTQSPAQREAWNKAMEARRSCAAGHVADHCVRLSDRLCGDHAYAADLASGRVQAVAA
jgi:hypothetical protein